MISTSRARPTRERCDRPSSASSSTAGDQPGRLAQGPDEKHGLAGRRVGFIAPSLPFQLPASGGGALAPSMPAVNAAAQHRAGRPSAPRLQSAEIGEGVDLEDREAHGAGAPSLANLILDRKP